MIDDPRLSYAGEDQWQNRAQSFLGGVSSEIAVLESCSSLRRYTNILPTRRD